MPQLRILNIMTFTGTKLLLCWGPNPYKPTPLQSLCIECNHQVLCVSSSCTWTGATGGFLLGVLTRLLHPREDLFVASTRSRGAAFGCTVLAGPIASVLADSARGLWGGRRRAWHRQWRLMIAFGENLGMRHLNSPVAALRHHLPWLLQSNRAASGGLQGAGGSMVLAFHMRGPGILDLIGIITEAICALIRVATVNCGAVVVGRLLHLAVSQYLFQKLTGSWHPRRITLALRGHVTPLRQWPPRVNLGLQEALWRGEMVAIHLTFQYRPDTGDCGGKLGTTVLWTITVYLMAYTKVHTNLILPSVPNCIKRFPKHSNRFKMPKKNQGDILIVWTERNKRNTVTLEFMGKVPSVETAC